MSVTEVSEWAMRCWFNRGRYFSRFRRGRYDVEIGKCYLIKTPKPDMPKGTRTCFLAYLDPHTRAAVVRVAQHVLPDGSILHGRPDPKWIFRRGRVYVPYVVSGPGDPREKLLKPQLRYPPGWKRRWYVRWRRFSCWFLWCAGR